MSTIHLPYDGRMFPFDRDQVETAYLVLLETPNPFMHALEDAHQNRMRWLASIARKLEDFGFGTEKFIYAQAAEIYAREKQLPTS